MVLFTKGTPPMLRTFSDMPQFMPMIPPIVSGDSAAAGTLPLPVDSGSGGRTSSVKAEVTFDQVTSPIMQTQTSDPAMNPQN